MLPRAKLDVEAAVAAVLPICDDVRGRGAEAVRAYTATFDGIDLPTTIVPRSALAAALAALDPAVAGALKENQRATLVGAPTYGKGSIQCPVPLQSMPAGLWLTVARFFSPSS